jgi:hypothetical protein
MMMIPMMNLMGDDTNDNDEFWTVDVTEGDDDDW